MVDDDDDGARRAAPSPRCAPSRYVYVENVTGELELYDLDARSVPARRTWHADPAYDAVEAALAARLASLRSCAGDELPGEARPEAEAAALEARERTLVPRGARTSSPGSVASVAGAVVLAGFRVGAERGGRDTAAPFKKRLKPRLLRAKRRPEVRVVAELLDGRELSLQKRVRICR